MLHNFFGWLSGGKDKIKNPVKILSHQIFGYQIIIVLLRPCF